MKNLLIIIWLHFLGDFILQSDKMAQNKSKSPTWLAFHVSVYSLPLFYFGWRYALWNALMHYGVDALSSQMTSYLWKKGDRHNFFVIIGLDQAVHLSCLVFSLPHYQA